MKTPDDISHLRYRLVSKHNVRAVAAFEAAGAAHRMMTHENKHCGYERYVVFDTTDNCTMTWGVKRENS